MKICLSSAHNIAADIGPETCTQRGSPVHSIIYFLTRQRSSNECPGNELFRVCRASLYTVHWRSGGGNEAGASITEIRTVLSSFLKEVEKDVLSPWIRTKVVANRQPCFQLTRYSNAKPTNVFARLDRRSRL